MLMDLFSSAHHVLGLLSLGLVASSGSCGLEVTVGRNEASRCVFDLVIVPNCKLETVAVHR